jgi:hypothetical protein
MLQTRYVGWLLRWEMNNPNKDSKLHQSTTGEVVHFNVCLLFTIIKTGSFVG